MDKLTNWTELFWSSLSSLGSKIGAFIPTLLGVIVILLLGWVFARFCAFLIARVLKLMKFDDIAEKVNAKEFLDRANVKKTPTQIVAKFIYWIIMLLVFLTACDTMGWSIVSNEISKLIGYIPKLFVAIVIFVIGTFIANFIKDVILGTTKSLGISSGKLIANIVFYFLFITIALTALNQAGIDTTIITSNLLLIFGAVLLTAAVSYSIASRDVLKNIIAGFFSKKTFKKGMLIELDDIKGTVVESNQVTVTILDAQGDKIVIPLNELITNKVKIISQ